ncbi:hypothetical protein VTK56DRAFT_3829 [Thermocarpiscus australiensis]
MGRRKIEIKAIQDDRNRSVTFLKRKGGLFKKAHELGVLCSVDVAVIIFGSNKKVHEYSSCDMRDLISRYNFHRGPIEHKGPTDFNGGVDEDEDDEQGSPPQGDGMPPPHFQAQPPFPHIRHQTPSASPPIPNGMFGPHPGNGPRGHTPQPQMGSRPSSRNDIQRMGPNLVGQPVGPQGPQAPSVNGFAFMPQPAVYNPQNAPTMPSSMPTQGLPQPPHLYTPPQPHTHQMPPFVKDQRRPSVSPGFPPQHQGPPSAPRVSVSPPQPPAAQLPQLPPRAPVAHMSPTPPQPQTHSMQSPPQPQQPLLPLPAQEPAHIPPPPQDAQPPAPAEPKPKPETADRARQPPLLDTSIKKHAPRKGGSIFTPIDENRSILSQHLAAFNPEVKLEAPTSRSQSMDAGSVSRAGNPASPPGPQRANTQAPPHVKRNGSLSSIPETVFTPPSRANSLRVGSISRPRLKVQIPDESDGGSATAESSSPRGTTGTDVTSQPSRRLADPHSSGVVLPPPSPSASALLSAGATGPPNPFARPPPHQNNSMNIDTPVSALPSRFLNNEYLPSPSSFYPEWNYRGTESNTLPSPLNFATPVVGTGPSFLRDDPTPHKRKSPEISGNGNHEPLDAGSDTKRVKVDS